METGSAAPSGAIPSVHDFVLDCLPAARAYLDELRLRPAASPGPDVESLRTAYLDLLKLCLCDLTGPSTVSVFATPDGSVASRELRGEALRLRAAGLDWPLQGLTMIGLARLADLQACVESVVRDGVEGDLIEAGAWRGGAALLMRAVVDTLSGPDRTVWVADSFQGFPQPEERHAGIDLSAYDYLAVPLEEVRESFTRLGSERGVRFVPGFFEETLPALSDGRWAVIRLDADTYQPTLLSLRCLYPGLAVGGYVIVDDYLAVEECRRAVDDFRAEHGIHEPIERIDWSCVRWRRQSEQAIPGPPADPAPRVPRPVPRPDPHAEPGAREIPTARELEMEQELAELRRRLAQAESELERLSASPLRGPAAWLRRRGAGRARPRR